MSFACGSCEPIPGSNPQGLQYFFHPKHHGAVREASRWCIDYKVEFDLCIKSRKNNKYMLDTDDKYSWNVLRDNDRLQQIGEQQGIAEYIARFDYDSSMKQLHGYPIDHTKNPREKPPNMVLKKLRVQNQISKKEMMKICKGLSL